MVDKSEQPDIELRAQDTAALEMRFGDAVTKTRDLSVREMQTLVHKVGKELEEAFSRLHRYLKNVDISDGEDKAFYGQEQQRFLGEVEEHLAKVQDWRSRNTGESKREPLFRRLANEATMNAMREELSPLVAAGTALTSYFISNMDQHEHKTGQIQEEHIQDMSSIEMSFRMVGMALTHPRERLEVVVRPRSR